MLESDMPDQKSCSSLVLPEKNHLAGRSLEHVKDRFLRVTLPRDFNRGLRETVTKGRT